MAEAPANSSPQGLRGGQRLFRLLPNYPGPFRSHARPTAYVRAWREGRVSVSAFLQGYALLAVHARDPVLPFTVYCVKRARKTARQAKIFLLVPAGRPRKRFIPMPNDPGDMG